MLTVTFITFCTSSYHTKMTPSQLGEVCMHTKPFGKILYSYSTVRFFSGFLRVRYDSATEKSLPGNYLEKFLWYMYSTCFIIVAERVKVIANEKDYGIGASLSIREQTITYTHKCLRYKYLECTVIDEGFFIIILIDSHMQAGEKLFRDSGIPTLISKMHFKYAIRLVTSLIWLKCSGVTKTTVFIVFACVHFMFMFIHMFPYM